MKWFTHHFSSRNPLEALVPISIQPSNPVVSSILLLMICSSHDDDDVEDDDHKDDDVFHLRIDNVENGLDEIALSLV